MKLTENSFRARRNQRCAAFTLMEILVVIAIIIIIAAIAFPVIGKIMSQKHKTTALNNMKQFSVAMLTYCSAHDGKMPDEDYEKNKWQDAMDPKADGVWYNAIPRSMQLKGVGDYAKENKQADFYKKDNILFMPGAQYPEGKKLEKPLFAISINGRIQRKDKDTDQKREIRVATIKLPSRTVLFLEQGLPNEKPKAHDTISGKDYDGAPKGSAKSFIARYSGKGIVSFFDGHAEEVSGKDLLDQSGAFKWQSDWAETNPGAIFWTVDPKDDPNAKSGSGGSGGGTTAP